MSCFNRLNILMFIFLFPILVFGGKITCPANPYKIGDEFTYSVRSMHEHMPTSGNYTDYTCQGKQIVKVIQSHDSIVVIERFDTLDCNPANTNSRHFQDTINWSRCDSTSVPITFDKFCAVCSSDAVYTIDGTHQSEILVEKGSESVKFVVGVGPVYGIYLSAFFFGSVAFDTVSLIEINGKSTNYSSQIHSNLKNGINTPRNIYELFDYYNAKKAESPNYTLYIATADGRKIHIETKTSLSHQLARLHGIVYAYWIGNLSSLTSPIAFLLP